MASVGCKAMFRASSSPADEDKRQRIRTFGLMTSSMIRCLIFNIGVYDRHRIPTKTAERVVESVTPNFTPVCMKLTRQSHNALYVVGRVTFEEQGTKCGHQGLPFV